MFGGTQWSSSTGPSSSLEWEVPFDDISGETYERLRGNRKTLEPLIPRFWLSNRISWPTLSADAYEKGERPIGV